MLKRVLLCLLAALCLLSPSLAEEAATASPGPTVPASLVISVSPAVMTGDTVTISWTEVPTATSFSFSCYGSSGEAFESRSGVTYTLYPGTSGIEMFASDLNYKSGGYTVTVRAFLNGELISAGSAAFTASFSPEPSATPTATGAAVTPKPTAVPRFVEDVPLTALPDAQPGDYVVFGSIEQDNVPLNGKEPIQWVVLSRSGSYLTLLPRKVLASREYHHTYTNVTWPKSSLRAWLNDGFLDAAFTPAEQAALVYAFCAGENNPWARRTSGGDDLYDRVYLLSYSQWEQYVKGQPWCLAPMTAAARAGIRHTERDQYKRGLTAAWWWLRNPGAENSAALFVSAEGLCDSLRSMNVNAQHGGVRPVICVDAAKYSDK